MPDVVHKYAGGTVVRVTALDVCGNVDDCYVVSSCMATGVGTFEYIEPQDLSPINGDGTACYVFETPPGMKWERWTFTFNAVDVRLKNAMTGSPLYLNDALVPEVVGTSNTRNMIAASNFAVELWLRQKGGPCAPGLQPHNYWIIPWLTNAKIGERTWGNQNTTLIVEGARTSPPSPWGVGPYNVERNAVTGVPRPLLTPIITTEGDEESSRELVTTLAPPSPSNGCQDPTPVFDVAPLAGVAPLAVVGTFPLDPVSGNPILPARIDWDDGTPVEVVTVGTTANHNYAAAGSYNAVFTPTAFSSPNYVSAEIVVS